MAQPLKQCLGYVSASDNILYTVIPYTRGGTRGVAPMGPTEVSLERDLGTVFSPQLRWLGFLYRSQRFLICFRKKILQSIYNYNTYLLLYMGARGAHCYR
jgi:hypothetical protein